MPKGKAASSSDSNSPLRPPTSLEAQENLMISLAVQCAEKQLRDGTASSQVITHYLKLGSSKERIEKEILEKQVNSAILSSFCFFIIGTFDRKLVDSSVRPLERTEA